MTRSRRARLVLWGLSALSFVPFDTALAQVPPPPPSKSVATKEVTPPPGPSVPPTLTASDVEAYLDGVIPLEIRKNDIAGAVVSVVKDGKLLFTKGYGFSDAKKRTPVTTDATLFRIGSISKTFTWTAVMQLVGQGKIDLDKDINTYLDFTIPQTFGKPVTMLNVMTHTAGFEENIKDLFVSGDAKPMGEYLKTHLPKQVYVPGTTPSYSNYAATLAGYVVERVSGMPFNDYIKKYITDTLNMKRTTFDQPLPAELKPFMSEGYARASQPPKKFETVQAWPAGSVSATAEDMAKYMIAHLEAEPPGAGEQLGAGPRILPPATALLMHARAFGVSAAVNGMAHGFYEESRNGQRIIGHGGDTQWFHSDMHFVLDQHLGFFISSNSAGKGEDLRGAVWAGFMDRYFPYTPPVITPIATQLADARSVAGSYLSSRRIESNAASVVNGISQDRVTVNADSTISASSHKDLAGNPKHYREIAPLVFREEHGQSVLAFVKDANGKLMMGADYPFEVGTAAPTLKNGPLNIGLICFALIVFALTVLAWPVTAMVRKHYGLRPPISNAYRRLRWSVRLTSLAALLFVVLLGVFFTTVLSDIASYTASKTGYFHFLQLLGVIGLLGVPAAALLARDSWRDGALWIWTKIWNSLLPLAFVAYAAFMFNWRLLTM